MRDKSGEEAGDLLVLVNETKCEVEMFRNKLIALIVMCVMPLVCGTLNAEVRYTITDLGTFGGDISKAYGLNDLGQVVGMSYLATGEQRAFRWDPNETNGTTGTMIDLGTLPGNTNSGASGINNSGYVAGDASDGVKTTSFIHDGNEMVALSLPLGYDPNDIRGTSGKSINEKGQIAGHLTWENGARRGYRWDPCSPGDTNGVMVNLGTIFAGDWSRAENINDNGRVCGRAFYINGTRGFLTEPNSATAIKLLPRDNSGHSFAYAVNNKPHAVGSSGGGKACIWYLESGQSQEPAIIIGILPGGSSAVAYAINESDEVVGYSETSGSDHAFYSTGSSITDLNTLIRPDSGWVLKSAYGINEVGQIVGYGTNPDGYSRGFLLTRECHYGLVGDVDNNCRFDLADLAIIFKNWLTDCSEGPLDPACILDVH